MLRFLAAASLFVASQALADRMPLAFAGLQPWGLDTCGFSGCWIDVLPTSAGHSGFGFTIHADAPVWTGRKIHFFCSDGARVSHPLAQTYPSHFVSGTIVNPCAENAVTKITVQMGVQGQHHDDVSGTVEFWAER